MKKLIFLVLGIALIVATPSCKKDGQPRYIKVEILKQTGEKIKQMEDLIDRNWAPSNPSTYDSLAHYGTNEVMVVLLHELKADTFRSDRGDIPLVISKYDEYWRGKHPKHQSKVWDGIGVGVQIDVYRVCKRYSDKLLLRLKNYCSGIVNGPPDWTMGERVDWMELEIQHLFIFDPDETVVWQYKDELNYYFKNFAINPNNKAKYKKDGFLNFGWGN